MQIIKATGLDRKSGGAQWRDLRFSGPLLGMFLTGRSVVEGPAVSFRVLTHPLKPDFLFPFAVRLKSDPDTKHESRDP